jgi:hypothetical protein
VCTGSLREAAFAGKGAAVVAVLLLSSDCVVWEREYSATIVMTTSVERVRNILYEQ